MIVGIGSDIVAIERVEESLQKLGEKFAQRLLTETEFSEYQNKYSGAAYLAKRFAAKEALVKALGTGFADGITWKQVSVHNNDKGAPYLQLSGAAQQKAHALGVSNIHLSLSDEKRYAVAFVVLESQ